jgi:hypothetical protein
MSETMGIADLLADKRDDILRAAAARGVRDVRVFGSVARGDAGPDSDVDLLVDLEPGRNLLDLGGFLMDLQAMLGRRVDVVLDGGVSPYMRDRILGEARPL